MNRLITKSEINNKLENIRETKENLESRLKHLDNKEEKLENLKEKPLGPACPICGKICKNTKGLKIHITLMRNNEVEGPHRNAFLSDHKIQFTDNGKIIAHCKKCGSRVVLNSRRKDRRIEEDGGVVCNVCGGDLDD